MRLDQALTNAKRITRKGSLPILANVRLSPKDGGIEVYATNLRVGWTCWVAGSINGTAVVDPKMLLPQVKGEREPTLRVEGRELSVGGMILMGAKPEDFPPTPRVEDGTRYALPEGWLTRAGDVSKAATADGSRLTLTAVMWAPEEDVLVAADGFRLRVSGAYAKPKGSQLLIPASGIHHIPKKVTAIEASEIRARFDGEGESLVVELVEGTFPSYRNLIPDGSRWSITGEVGPMYEAVKACEPIARDDSGVVRIKVRARHPQDEPRRIEVSAWAQGIGDVSYDVPALVSDKIPGEVKIAMNVRYAIDALATIAGMSNGFELRGTSPTSLMIWTPSPRSEWLEIVMPMFVQW